MPELLPATQKLQTLGTLLQTQEKQFRAVLRSEKDTKRFFRLALNAATATPKLLACTKESFVGALMECATLNLEPVAGQAWILPYSNQAKLIVGYKGLLALATRSGRVAMIFARVVYEKDEFSYRDYPANLYHTRHRGEDRGEKVAAYAVAKFLGGQEQWEVMEGYEILRVKKRSPASSSKSSPWNHPEDEAEMWKKTVFKRLCKVLPMAIEDPKLSRAIELDNLAETGKEQHLEVDLAPPGPKEVPEDYAGKIATALRVLNGNTATVKAILKDQFQSEDWGEVKKMSPQVLKDVYANIESALVIYNDSDEETRAQLKENVSQWLTMAVQARATA